MKAASTILGLPRLMLSTGSLLVVSTAVVTSPSMILTASAAPVNVAETFCVEGFGFCEEVHHLCLVREFKKNTSKT